MADDLDDLLNSVERCLKNNHHSEKLEKTTKSGQASRLQRRSTEVYDRSIDGIVNKKLSTDISDILDDSWLDDDDDVRGSGMKGRRVDLKPRKSVPNIGTGLSSSLASSSSSSWSDHDENKRLQQSSSCMKCLAVYLGGSVSERGICTSVTKRTCDRLRCTDCDFVITSFDDYKWRSETDYMFLRNNMPDVSRLKSNLVSKSGWRAYACQCQWFHTDHQVSLPAGLKWVCGKH